MRTIIIFTISFFVFIVGCASQGALVWTPTPEQWALMSPAERNQWYMTEMAARRQRQDYFNNLGEAIGRIGDQQEEITVYPRQQPSYIIPYGDSEQEKYYRRKNWEDWQRRLRGEKSPW